MRDEALAGAWRARASRSDESGLYLLSDGQGGAMAQLVVPTAVAPSQPRTYQVFAAAGANAQRAQHELAPGPEGAAFRNPWGSHHPTRRISAVEIRLLIDHVVVLER